MCRVVRRNGEMKIKEQKLQKVEGKGFFFIFYLKIVWVYDNGNFYKENYVTATLGEVTSFSRKMAW